MTLFESVTEVGGTGLMEKGWEWWGMYLKFPMKIDNMVISVPLNYGFRPGEDTISVIASYARAYREENGEYKGDVYDYPVYKELVRAYSLQQILSDYGSPDQIYMTFSPDWNPVLSGYFDLDVWYPDKGIFMKYRMNLQDTGDNIKFCPSDSFVHTILLPPGLGESYQEILVSLGFQDYFPRGKSPKTPEEALGMSIEEFYEIFRSPTDRCLESPISVWGIGDKP
jgi:hypothetical protein